MGVHCRHPCILCDPGVVCLSLQVMKFMEEPLSFKGMAEIQLGNYIIREVCGPPVLVHTYI